MPICFIEVNSQSVSQKGIGTISVHLSLTGGPVQPKLATCLWDLADSLDGSRASVATRTLQNNKHAAWAIIACKAEGNNME
jgi:hypothetical protein